MRFCMVTTYYPPYHFGGDATYVHALSRALVKLGHEVEVMHCVDAYRLKKADPMPLKDVADVNSRDRARRDQFEVGVAGRFVPQIAPDGLEVIAWPRLGRCYRLGRAL